MSKKTDKNQEKEKILKLKASMPIEKTKHEKRIEVLYVKMTETEKEYVREKADKYFAGNLSDLGRFCLFTFNFAKNKPPKKRK